MDVIEKAVLLNLEALSLSGLTLDQYMAQVRIGITTQTIQQSSTRIQAARRLGVHRNTLHRWESSRHNG